MKRWTESRRIGGLMLMLGAASMPFIIAEYVFITSAAPPVAQLAERLAYYEESYPILARGWHFEVIAMALLGAGALVCMNGRGRAGWALAAIGVAAVLPMYTLMVGGYRVAYDEAEFGLALFHLTNAVATELFYVGNFLTSAGFGLALFHEWKAPGRVVPGWVLLLGAISNSIASLGFLALHAGMAIPLASVGPFGMLGFISIAVFGAFLAFNRNALDQLESSL